MEHLGVLVVFWQMLHPKSMEFILEKRKEWTPTVGGFQRTPTLHGGEMIGEQPLRSRLWSTDRKRNQLLALRSGDDHPVLKRLFLKGRA